MPVAGVPPALTVTAVATGAEALVMASSCQKIFFPALVAALCIY